MSETLKLRTTPFGGFARQDVVDYIEQNARNHAAQLNALRGELKAAEERLAVLDGEHQRAEALEERCAMLEARVSELESVAEEVESLRLQMSELKPQAEAYASLGATVAEIELDARSRANQMIRAAEEEAEAKRQQAQALLDQVMSEYTRVGSSANSAIADVIGKLTELKASLAGLSALRSDMEQGDK